MTDKEKLLDIHNQINEHFSQDEPAPEPKGELKLHPWIPQTWDRYGFSDNKTHYDVHDTPLKVGRHITLTVIVSKRGEVPNVDNQIKGVEVFFNGVKKITGKDGGGRTAQYSHIVKEGRETVDVNIDGDSFTYIIRGKSEQQDTEEDNHEPVLPPPGDTQVYVLFQDNGGKIFDVKLNNTWHYFKNPDFRVGSSKGFIVHLDKKLVHFELKPEQMKIEGLNAHGFGFCHYKIISTNLTPPQINSGNWYKNAGSGSLIGRCGKNMTVFNNPNFYKLSVPNNYNHTGKILISITGYGKDNPNFSGPGCS